MGAKHKKMEELREFKPSNRAEKKPAMSALTGQKKITRMFNHEDGPVPWVEIAIDETVVLRGIDKPVTPEMFDNIQPIDISWSDRVNFAQRFGLDALGIYHWESYGSIEDDSLPVLKRTPLIKERKDLKKLIIPEFSFQDLAPQVAEAKQAIGESGVALFVEFAICLEYALLDLGFENFCLKMYDDPSFIDDVLDLYTTYSIQLIKIYNQMPEIDFIWIGDDLAYGSGPFFSPGVYRRHIFPFFKKAISAIEKPWVFHSDGNILPLMDEILSWGPSALHPLEPGAMDIFKVKQDYGKRVALIGNLSVDRLARAEPDEIAHETRALLEKCARGGGYGFSSGNALARYVKYENVLAVSKTLREFNRTWS